MWFIRQVVSCITTLPLNMVGPYEYTCHDHFPKACNIQMLKSECNDSGTLKRPVSFPAVIHKLNGKCCSYRTVLINAVNPHRQVLGLNLFRLC